jgi:arabinose-5-phosphate isomerase
MTQTSPTADVGEATRAADLAAARRVLSLEVDALNALARALDGSFSAAVDLLARVRGRVVVSGMGKSGHVARKIAGTLASTGTPALFVHPAEASHGDLGMITPEDAALVLSNSGNTDEIRDVVGYTRRFSVPLVGMTSGAASSLAEASDVALVLPPAREACPNGLAPTTSTTLMMALGDALAVALMERKGFSPDQFQVFHPGGKLGARLLRVADLMHTGEAVPLVRPDTPMSETMIVMTAKSFGCAGVVDDSGRLAGIVTDGDLRRHMGAGLMAETAGSVMTRWPKTIEPRSLAAEALGRMNASAITCLFVVEDGRPVGIVHIHDCLRAGVA